MQKEKKTNREISNILYELNLLNELDFFYVGK